MNLNVTQDNLFLFLPSKISWMAEMLSEDKKISIINAIKEIYASDIYRRLETEETKLWHLGPVALYEEMTEQYNETVAVFKWTKWMNAISSFFCIFADEILEMSV